MAQSFNPHGTAMRYDINPKMVAGIMAEVNQVLTGRQYNNVEVVVALQELIGRTIVQMCSTPVQATSIIELAKTHLDDTCRIGFTAKEQPLIQRV